MKWKADLLAGMISNKLWLEAVRSGQWCAACHHNAVHHNSVRGGSPVCYYCEESDMCSGLTFEPFINELVAANAVLKELTS